MTIEDRFAVTAYRWRLRRRCEVRAVPNVTGRGTLFVFLRRTVEPMRAVKGVPA